MWNKYFSGVVMTIPRMCGRHVCFRDPAFFSYVQCTFSIPNSDFFNFLAREYRLDVDTNSTTKLTGIECKKLIYRELYFLLSK